MDRARALALYEAVIATNPVVGRKGDTVPHTSLNGHMFSALHKDHTSSREASHQEAQRARLQLTCRGGG